MIFVSLVGALTIFGVVLKNFVFADEPNPAGILSLEYRNGNEVKDVENGDEFKLRPAKRTTSTLLEDVFATVSVDAEFGAGTDKKITVKVPTGLAIKKYSATSGTVDMDGVEKVEIDNAYKDYVLTSDLTAATSDTHVLDKDGNMVKYAEGSSWEEQKIVGYAALGKPTDANQRTYGGDITWTFTPETTIMHLTFSIAVDSYVLNHTAAEEALGNVVVEMSSSLGAGNKSFSMKATNLQVFKYGTKSNYPGSSNYSINGISQEPGLEDYSNRFGVGAAGNSYSNVSGYQVFLADEVEFTFTYYPGVYYDNLLDLAVVGQSLVADRDTCGSNCRNEEIREVEPCSYGECYKEFDITHGRVVIDQAEGGGGTITITLSDIRHRHMSNINVSGDVRIAAYFRADNRIYNGDNSTATVNGGWAYRRNGVSSSASRIEWKRNLIFDDGAINISISPKNLTLRNYDKDYDSYPYKYILGGFNITAALPYNDVRMEFDFEDVMGKMGVKEVAFPGNNLRNINCETTNGRVITLEEQEDTDGDSLASLTYGFAVNQEDLGLAEDEYIKKIAATMDYPAQGTYNISNYTSNAGSFYGHFLDVEDGDLIDEVRLSVIDDEGNVLINGETGEEMTSLGRTTVGWNNTGVSDMIASTSLSSREDSNETTFYPNQTILFKSSFRGSSYARSGSHVVDPIIIISLPESIKLDMSSVKIVSQGNGIGQVELEQLARPGDVVEGWKTYYYKVRNPLSLIGIALTPHHDPDKVGTIGVEFKATVDNSVELMNLSMKDILSYDVGKTAVNGSSLNIVYPDTYNKAGKNTDDSIYNLAAAGGNIVIKPLVGLNVDIGIRTKGYNQDFVTYNGQDSSIAVISREHPAEVEVKYHSTSVSDFKENTVIYMPVPKKEMDYEKYFENMGIENPGESTENARFEYSAKLASVPTMVGDDGTTWTTYFTTDELKSNNDYAVGDGSWEPAITTSDHAIEWVRADEFNTNNLNRVTMMKFVANGAIKPDSFGRCVYDLELNSTVEREMDAVNYWRTYNKSVTDDDNTGIWGYSSIIAANADGVDLKGQLFVDRNANAVYQNPDTAYSEGGYRLYLIREDNTEPVRELVVNENGSFTNRAKNGEEEPIDFALRNGVYRLEIVKDEMNNFVISGLKSEYRSNSQKYYNDVNSDDSTINDQRTEAIYTFEIDENTVGGTKYVYYIGVGLLETDLTLEYEWSGNVPDGVILPEDDNVYESGDKITIDDEYTDKIEIEGELDGKNGVFKFSGWKKDDNIDAEDRILGSATISGVWVFEPEKEDDVVVPDTGKGGRNIGALIGAESVIVIAMTAVIIRIVGLIKKSKADKYQ